MGSGGDQAFERATDSNTRLLYIESILDPHVQLEIRCARPGAPRVDPRISGDSRGDAPGELSRETPPDCSLSAAA